MHTCACACMRMCACSFALQISRIRPCVHESYVNELTLESLKTISCHSELYYCEPGIIFCIALPLVCMQLDKIRSCMNAYDECVSKLSAIRSIVQGNLNFFKKNYFSRQKERICNKSDSSKLKSYFMSQLMRNIIIFKR